MTAECGGHSFTVKGKTVLVMGWRACAARPSDTALPDDLAQGQTLAVEAVQVKEGQTAPPKHFTEDTILASMECAGAEDMPNYAERRGIGTPATRAAILEKLVATGLVERKKARKITNLLPTQAGSSLVAVLPEALQSPLLTADWEQRLGQVERGELSPEDFMEGITAMVKELVNTYQPVPGADVLFPSGREAVGPCPRCGGAVVEHKKGFFCENREFRFVLWKDSKLFTAKKKTLTKAVAAALLNKGRVKLTGCFSEKTGKTYDATVVLEDDGTRANYMVSAKSAAPSAGSGKTVSALTPGHILRAMRSSTGMSLRTRFARMNAMLGCLPRKRPLPRSIPRKRLLSIRRSRTISPMKLWWSG